MIVDNPIISGSVQIQNAGQAQIPVGTKTQRPSSPDTGSLFLETSASGSAVMVYKGTNNSDGGWHVLGNENRKELPQFFYRNIINYAYTAGGYINSSPWKTVHRTTASTDQTVNVGDLLDYPSSYSSGACSKTILFMWSVNTDGTWKSATTVADTFTSAVNMVTETNYAHQTKFDLANARDNLGTVFQETEFAWMFGGSVATVEKFNLTNESMYANTWSSITSSLGCSAFSDLNWGYVYGSESGVKIQFATDTIFAAQQWAPSGQQKGISSKLGFGFCGNEGTYNGGYNLRTWYLANESNIGTVSKPHANCGEENFTMGQDWQYMIGCYDGTGQTNNSWKFTYATRTGSENPSGLAPTAHAGQSSGHFGWRN